MNKIALSAPSEPMRKTTARGSLSGAGHPKNRYPILSINIENRANVRQVAENR
jgi:hypothetical protein